MDGTSVTWGVHLSAPSEDVLRLSHQTPQQAFADLHMLAAEIVFTCASHFLRYPLSSMVIVWSRLFHQLSLWNSKSEPGQAFLGHLEPSTGWTWGLHTQTEQPIRDRRSRIIPGGLVKIHQPPRGCGDLRYLNKSKTKQWLILAELSGIWKWFKEKKNEDLDLT